ncbi:MAG: 30S ribosomal protein S12 methylthiotransferase RimO, partial [Planctomycetota bacterium]
MAFVSLGCPKNLVDSEKMLGLLHEGGFRLVSDHDEADALVTLDAIREAVDRKTRGALQRVVVAGCLVQRHRAKLLEWAPGIDALIGVFDRDHVLDAVAGDAADTRATALGEAGPEPRYWIAGNALQAARERGRDTVGLTVKGNDGQGLGYFEDDSGRLRLTPRHWAYLRVSEGCNQKCTFCTIPSIRGKMRSKPLATIETEARSLMSDGAFELNLIGQDTTSYGYDIGYDDETAGEGLVGLLTSLDRVAGEHGGGWMRLMYVYPSNFTDEMIDAIAALPNIVKYIDIPLQHATDRMLRHMRRRITRAEQEALLTKLRDRIPGLAIRTTLITGFPGETEEDHRELVEFVDAFGFDMLGVFRYSREEGTPAGTMDLDPELHVPDEVKADREAELMLTQQRIAFDNAAYLAEQACQFDVLLEGPSAGETAGRATSGVSDAGRLYVGRFYPQAPQVDSLTYVHSTETLAAGELVR